LCSRYTHFEKNQRFRISDFAATSEKTTRIRSGAHSNPSNQQCAGTPLVKAYFKVHMKTYNEQITAERLHAELNWRMDELRLTQDAARLLEVRKEIRLLEEQISKLEYGREKRGVGWMYRGIH